MAGALTLLLDAAKGYLAVRLAAHFTGASIRWMMVAAVAAVIGHVFPIWLGFRGGKGVATGLGVFFPICWQLPSAGVVLAAGGCVLAVFFAGVIAAAAAMPVSFTCCYAPRHAPPDIVTIGTTFVALLILVKHRENIRRLVAGEESKLKLTRSEDDFTLTITSVKSS